MSTRRLKFLVDSNSRTRRLDVFLSERQDELSRSGVKKLIEQGRISVNGSAAKANYKLKEGDRIVLDIPPPTASEVEAEAIPLKIIYEDDVMLAVDKPAGMVVHPAPGHGSGTLVNALLNHCSDLSGIGGVERPGIVHRLDKDTSGVVLVAKNEKAHRTLARQFKNRDIKKTYLALVRGTVKKTSGVIDAPVGRHKINRKKMVADSERGRQAQTRYEVLETFGHFSYLRLFPKTGRTHQIRVHLASINHPVLGDGLYGGKVAAPYQKMPRQALHAHQLETAHPVTGKPMIFEAPLPPDIADYLKTYRQKLRPES
ncbi:RNA pseudouridine synthase [Candidatus Nitromaritima sp. SCGC AAA799-C22]|nr:RNA pseudouridine synthase [Candidatus Nitromaritima sp. SCGC AAA799-C22]